MLCEQAHLKGLQSGISDAEQGWLLCHLAQSRILAGDPEQGVPEARQAVQMLTEAGGGARLARPRCQHRVRAVHQVDHRHGAQREGDQLGAGCTARGINELRQEREEEQDHLGVEEIDDDAVGHVPHRTDRSGRIDRVRSAMWGDTQLPDAQVHQECHTAEFDRGERPWRGHQQTGKSHRSGQCVDQRAGCCAQSGTQPGQPAALQTTGDHEGERGSGHQEDRDGGKDERKERLRCGHEPGR